jgi:hypothetical protein
MLMPLPFGRLSNPSLCRDFATMLMTFLILSLPECHPPPPVILAFHWVVGHLTFMLVLLLWVAIFRRTFNLSFIPISGPSTAALQANITTTFTFTFVPAVKPRLSHHFLL